MSFNVALSSPRVAKAFGILQSAGMLTAAIRDVAEKLVAETRKNITSQGKHFESPWKAASKWTVARTGRSKLLQDTEHMVQARHSKDHSEVIFVSDKDWSLKQHHEGFTRPATQKLERIVLKKPSALGLKKNVVFFVSKKAQKTPARRILPQQQRARQIAAAVVTQWAKRVERSL